MFSGFLNAFSGMLSFQNGLNTISNNLANMNTPGFKGNALQFRSMVGGAGAYTSDNQLNFAAGDARQTGNDLNAFINGSGFFILQDENGQQFYTRNGDFDFSNNYLVDRNSGYKVLGFNESGAVSPISIQDFVTLRPEATTQINFSNNLNSDVASYELSITAFNSLGEELDLNVKFTNNKDTTPRSFLFEVTLGDDTIGNGEIRFDANGDLSAGFEDFTIAIPGDLNGTTEQAQEILWNFAGNDDISATTLITTGQSNLSVAIEDGHSNVGLVGTSFNSAGELVFKYSDNSEITPYTLALAHFSDTSDLSQIDGSLFHTSQTGAATIGEPGSGQFGSIQGGTLEASNVDMIQEFSQMLIVQRGYQASSQVLNVANDMIEQLYNQGR